MISDQFLLCGRMHQKNMTPKISITIADFMTMGTRKSRLTSSYTLKFLMSIPISGIEVTFTTRLAVITRNSTLISDPTDL